jgi:hypothetical protein
LPFPAREPIRRDWSASARGAPAPDALPARPVALEPGDANGTPEALAEADGDELLERLGPVAEALAGYATSSAA